MGSIFDYLSYNQPFGDIPTRTYFHQLMDGLHAMHKKGFLHRDLKPENLLIDKYYTLKIADFGFSRSFVDPLIASNSDPSISIFIYSTINSFVLMKSKKLSKEVTLHSSVSNLLLTFLLV